MAKPGAKSTVRHERHGPVQLLVIERPQARNALDVAVLADLARLLERGDADCQVRAFVITGGHEIFSAGADVDTIDGLNAATYAESGQQRAFEAIRSTRKPVIAAVAGFCLGGGCEMALGCDLVVAGDTAQFAQPEIRLGIIPGAGGTQLWAERTGAGPQALAALTGGRVDAFEARRLGLVDRVVPSGKVVEAALALAQVVASHAPLAIVAAKAAIRARWSGPLSASLRTETLLMASLLASRDAREGLEAFLEKRAPNFEGH